VLTDRQTDKETNTQTDTTENNTTLAERAVNMSRYVAVAQVVAIG